MLGLAVLHQVVTGLVYPLTRTDAELKTQNLMPVGLTESLLIASKLKFYPKYFLPVAMLPIT